MNSQNQIPLDIESARSYGIQKWREEFFWPVSYKSYMQMETEIKHSLNELIDKNMDNELSELLVINYKLFLEYSSFLYSLRVLKDVHSKKLIPLCSKASINFKGIVENEIPLGRRLAVPAIQTSSFKKRIRTIAAKTKLHMKLSNSASAFLKRPFISSSCIANYSSLIPFSYEYIRNRLDGCVTLKAPEEWYSMSNDISISRDQKEKIIFFSNEIIQRVEKIAVNYGLHLTTSQRAYLRDITIELLLPSMLCVQALNRYVSTLKPLHLITGSGGNHFTRMLSVAVRGNGGTVTGVTHAEPLIHSWDLYSWMELSTLDKFITYTKHSANTMEAVRKKFPPLKANPVKIEGMETNIFYHQWQRESKKPVPGRVERVMVVAKGLENDNRIGQGIGMPELMQLDWEFRIINILRKAGYKVLYKVHPRGVLSEQVRNVFGNDVQVVYEYFEDVLDLADAFLFYFTMTTTIGQALCTNKPVIYINGGWEPWFPQVYESFSTSCRIVSSHFDERNRLIINEEELLEALARNPAKPNQDFMGKYMFPGGV